MKKVIIALVLVSLIMVPAFAKRDEGNVGAEASAKFAVDANGVKFQGVGIYGTYKYQKEEFSFGAKLGYVFSLDKDPAVSGVYVEVEKPLDLGKTSVSEIEPKVALGLAADFHIVDGEFLVNLAPEASFAIEMPIDPNDSFKYSVGAGLSVRYALLNNTGVAPFSFDVEVGAATPLDK